jgi:hypothetical protein
VRRLNRNELVGIVAQSLYPEQIDDLPAIRQAINDTADSYRKDGYSVRDFAQDAMVRDVQRAMRKGVTA